MSAAPEERLPAAALRSRVAALLADDDGPTALAGLAALPLRPAIRELQGLLPSAEPLVRLRAATALGRLGAVLAREDLEAGRDLLRRLMWSLNDESGGIGWGAPEAMAETLVRHRGLAEEFGAILISYLTPGANQLEFPPLRAGAARAVERLARTWPDLAGDAAPEWLRQLGDRDPELRGLARLGLYHLGRDPASLLPEPAEDRQSLQVFVGWDFRALDVDRLDAATAAAVRSDSRG